MILAGLAAAIAAAAMPTLVCHDGYKALSARLVSQDGLLQDPPTAERPWRELKSPDGQPVQRLYSIAMPGAEGYPAIVQRIVRRGAGTEDIGLAICCWASKRECANLRQDFQALDDQLRKSETQP